MRKLARNELNVSVALSYICLFANVAGSLIITPMLVRQLGTAEYGLYMLAYSVGMYVSVDGMGIGGVVIRQVQKALALDTKEDMGRYVFQSFLIFTVLAAVSYAALRLIGLGASTLFAGSVEPANIQRLQWMLNLTAANCALLFFFNLLISLITGHGRLIFVKGITLLRIVLRTLAVIAMIGWLRIEMLVLLDLGITCAVLLAALVYAARTLGVRLQARLDRGQFRAAFRQTGFLFVSLVSDNVCWNSGGMIVAMSFGEASAGIYAIAMTLCGVFSQLSASISGLFLPEVTALVVSQASAQTLLNKMIQTGRRLMALLMLVILGFGLLGREFLVMYLTADYLPAYAIALPLMIALLYPATQLVGDSVIQAMDQFNARSAIQLLSSLVTIGLSLWLIPMLGLSGAWVGLAASVVVFRIIVTNLLLERLGLDMRAYFHRTVPRMALIMAGLAPALWLLFQRVDMGFLFKCAITAAAYAAAIWTCYLDRTERASFTALVRKEGSA